MNGKHNRVGIIASSALAQHMLQSVIAEAGYEIAVNTSPERLNLQFLRNETIRLWVIELEEDDRWSDFLSEAIEQTTSPILFGEGQIPAKTDPSFNNWCKRLLTKLTSFAPVVETAPDAPDINLDFVINKPSRPVLSLPESLKHQSTEALGPVWVLCASLGGPQAVKEFLDALPEDLPASFLYGQHIDAGCMDALVQSVGRHTGLKMVDALDGVYLANCHVFVVPVNHEITISSTDRIEQQANAWSGPYGPSHDQLLENMAMRYGERCNCIIFSGMGSDGALGASLVKAAGGSVWAQSSVSCVQSSMPDAATDTGVVDERGSPTELAEKLVKWLEKQKSKAA